MRGSWAGAMGQPQFMPTTFQAHATDGDGDGRHDIWGSVPDALTSAANYLAAIDWRRGEPWGREISLPAGFDAYQARLPLRLSDAQWGARGVRAADGGALTDLGLEGSIVLPAGIDGPAFLVYDNFGVITEWNRSIFYGLTVGILSQRLSGGPGLVGRAPPAERRLRRSEVMELQSALNRLGYGAGTPDGMIGMQTRQALRDFQRDRGLVPDAYPGPATIAALRGQAPPTGQPGVTQADILALQRGLNARGYDAGIEDGLWGEKTRHAFDAWLSDQGLAPGTAPTPALIQRIGAPARGLDQARYLDPRLSVPRQLDGGLR
jgi:peptidoglycan hydrolase-like protein with peptidoglycan-binding domain